MRNIYIYIYIFFFPVPVNLIKVVFPSLRISSFLGQNCGPDGEWISPKRPSLPAKYLLSHKS